MVNRILKQIDELEKNVKYSENMEDNYRELIYSYPVLNKADELSLFKIYNNTKDTLFKDVIFKCHLRDVYDCCTDITGYKLDLVSEGNILMYELIDKYDYTVPYTTFSNFLKTRLTVLYKNMTDENNTSLDTKMSTHELASLEDKGKNLTEEQDTSIYEKIESYKKKKSNKTVDYNYLEYDYSKVMTEKLYLNKELVLKKKNDALKLLKIILKK